MGTKLFHHTYRGDFIDFVKMIFFLKLELESEYSDVLVETGQI